MISRPRTTARPRLGLVLTLLVGAPLVVLLVWPQAFGAEQAMLVAHALSFRTALAIGLGVLALAFAAIALARRRWGVAAALAVLLGVASVANGGIMLARGSHGALAEGELVVVAWNTHERSTRPAEIARLALETDADIVSLPETGSRTVTEVVRLLALEGKRMVADTAYGPDGSTWLPTSLLVSADLGEYRIDAAAGSTPGIPSAVWRPVGGDGPTIVAAHPMPPLPSMFGRWQDGLAWIADRCDDPTVIVAGDLNATVDHFATALAGGCRDAAAEAGAAAVGTWPASVPVWIAAPIDHVLVGSAWEVRGATVLTSYDEAGSDHRPIVAVLAPR
ncbi:endonuclease/exonuclease/phosphatase family protein [Microbacterium sp. No. 7]|uniref:endonuclease/exonuclease/phosphatase family protein n=1 Tax=Microbacterium sp. No. 7 TaxID=1714373 RepID=UPI0006D27A6B|nr:endonuclease/exonuclease/phosphatase family protein [Microbacterium sp. No. 7]ALJ18492.1 hypothetical protein AOA12_00600 [Microbacterium sp. No. 7]